MLLLNWFSPADYLLCESSLPPHPHPALRFVVSGLSSMGGGVLVQQV